MRSTETMTKKCCDNCKQYSWYYDHCSKWDSRTDGREVHGCFEKRAKAVVGTQVSESKTGIKQKHKD